MPEIDIIMSEENGLTIPEPVCLKRLLENARNEVLRESCENHSTVSLCPARCKCNVPECGFRVNGGKISSEYVQKNGYAVETAYYPNTSGYCAKLGCE